MNLRNCWSDFCSGTVSWELRLRLPQEFPSSRRLQPSCQRRHLSLQYCRYHTVHYVLYYPQEIAEAKLYGVHKCCHLIDPCRTKAMLLHIIAAAQRRAAC